MAMTVSYSVVPRKNPAKKSEPAKYYAQAQASGELDFEEMCEANTSRSTCTETGVRAAISGILYEVKRALKAGRIARLGDLGSLQIGLNSEGAASVKDLDYDTILKNIAIVFQKTFLTRDSVLENIRMGSNATLEEVRAAAKEAQIDDFIMSLPDGYETKVGSFGSRFSGGEKQRIAIARAILKNAPILIWTRPQVPLTRKIRWRLIKLFKIYAKAKQLL